MVVAEVEVVLRVVPAAVVAVANVVFAAGWHPVQTLISQLMFC